VADGSRSRRLLFISNGHGEDSIGAEVIRRLPPGLAADAFPMLGSGAPYAGIARILGPRATIPSEGSRLLRGSLLRDLLGGALGTLAPSLAFLRRAKADYDGVVVIGDFVGVALCWLAGAKGLTYLDVYKTGYGRGYSGVEKAGIAATCDTVFCRHDELAAALRGKGTDARAVGNVMMDTITFGDYAIASRRAAALALALLPGSRADAVESFARQVAALRRLPPDLLPDIFVALAGGVAPVALAEAAALRHTGPLTGDAADMGTLRDDRLTLHLARGATGNLLHAADIVLSQAGTATVQAVGLGKPVITFRDPRERQSRFRAESALFGDARLATANDPAEIAEMLAGLLRDEGERLRRGAIGRQRIGGPGAIEIIIETLAMRSRA